MRVCVCACAYVRVCACACVCVCVRATQTHECPPSHPQRSDKYFDAVATLICHAAAAVLISPVVAEALRLMLRLCSLDAFMLRLCSLVLLLQMH